MKCSKCQSDMFKTNVGWLCHNCGHAEIDGSKAADVGSMPPKQDKVIEPPAPAIHAASIHSSGLAAAPPSVPTQPAAVPEPTPPLLHQAMQANATPEAVPNQAVSNGWTDPTVNAAKPKRRVPKFVWVGGIIVLVLLLLVGAGAAYAFIIQPKQAMTSYLGRIVGAKTATYSSTINFESENDEGDAEIFDKSSVSLKGAYDLNDTANPKFKVNVTGKFGAQSVGADAVIVDKALFFKIGQLGLLDTFGVKLSSDWYKLPLEEGFEDNACYNKTKGDSGQFLGLNVLADLPVKDTKRVGTFTVVDGRRVAHFTGSIDFDKLQAYIDKANQSLPAECKLTYNADDFKDVSVEYEIFSGKDFDRINIKAKDTKGKSTTNITLDTSGYNQPVDIKAPENAKSLEDLMSMFMGASSVDTDGGNTGTTSANDSQRKSDLRAVKNALETYYNDNNYYPPGNYAGLSKVLANDYISEMPADPKGGAYIYIPSPTGCKADNCTNYVLQATLENSKDSQIKVGTASTYEITSTN